MRADAMSEDYLWHQENRTLWREKWNLIDDNIRLSGRLTNLEEEKVILLLQKTLTTYVQEEAERAVKQYKKQVNSIRTQSFLL